MTENGTNEIGGGSLKKHIAVLLLCGGILLLAGCGGESAAPAGAPENPGNVYRVIVTDEAGAPVEGVTVQFCSDAMCLMGETDADGIAVYPDVAEGSYTVHVLKVPDGYADDETEYPAPETYGDVAVTLQWK